LFRIASDRRTEIDEDIQKHAENWRMDRMSAVDRNLLRLGVAEFLGFPKTARAIVINEGLEIARLYSAPESIHFINGVLDSIGKDLDKRKAAS
jgi:N utilization substance protein B